MNYKKILMSCIIIVILIISILAVCILMLNAKGNNKSAQNNNLLNQDIIEEKVKEVTDNTKFFTVSDCISQYLNEINKNNTRYYGMNDNGKYEKIVEEKYIQQNIYNILSEEYIKGNNITVENVYDYVYDVTEQLTFIPIKMNQLILEDTQKYVTYGYIVNLNNLLIKDAYILVNLDINNKTFSVEPKNDRFTSLDEIEITKKNLVIEKRDNNTFKYVNPTPEYIAKKYFNTYKRLVLAKPEIAYDFLDEQYKINKFQNVENFKKYIEKNRTKILNSTISKYNITSDNGYKRYICIDQNENYYIFKETAIMKYSVILDTYTIDLPEYIEKYNKSSSNQKVALCINKFIKNINDENYTLAYSMLSQGFKNNYFKNQASFEAYVKQNLLGKDQITFEEIQNEAEVYIYKVILTDSNNEANKVEKNFNVKLGAGTKFELSFNMK